MMRVLLWITLTGGFALGGNLFVNDIKADLLDKDTKQVVGEIYEGTPITVIKDMGEMTLISISGEIIEGDDHAVALTKEPLVVFYKLHNKKATPKAEFLISSKKLSDDGNGAWEEIELMYYDTCSSCHAAHKPKEHLMSEWAAYLLAMQTFAKINDEERDRLLRFLQAFAKDGIMKE
ncbi:MAG: hypothetical protein ACTTH5_04640 [Wolinella sp.]